jgi:23S rRNA-/tRNA-specific pseudouridylate synthase
MILALSSKASRQLADEFANKEVKKEYVARVKGKFPEWVLAAVRILRDS